MNNQNCEDQQQSLEFLDCYYSFQLPDGSSLNSPCLKPLNMKFGCKGSSSAATHGALQPISSRFGSQVSPFYAAEHYMGIPQYDCQVSTLPLFSQLSKNYTPDFPSYQPCEEHFSVDSVREDGSDLQSRDMLQSVVKFGLHGNQDQPIQFQQDYPGRQFLDLQEKAVVENPVLKRSQSIVPYKGNQDSRVSYDAFKRHLYPEKQILEMSSGVDKHVSSGPVTISSKTRIRWTQDLHEQFVECVNRLGGAEKATPKGILNLMDSDGLTIFHVKSHLQKYRNAKYTPEPAEGKSDKRNSLNDLRKLDPKTGVQIAEALQLQLEVQKRLHEQLEIQRNLQMRIEEQGKQLKKMFDQQQQSSKSLVDTDNLDSPVEAQVSSLGEESGNTHFPSKIS